MPKIKNQSAVLDIGSKSVEIIIGEQGINGILKIKARGSCGYDGFSEGKFLVPQKVAAAIYSALEDAENTVKSPVKKLFVTVPGEFSSYAVKDAAIAFKTRRKVTEIDINELLSSSRHINTSGKYELIGRYPIYHTVDETRRTLNPKGQPAVSLSGRLSFLYAECAFTAFIREILDKINVECEFISGALAVTRILFPGDERPCMVADVGYLTTTVAMGRGEGLLYMKSFSAGGAYVSADLMECLHIPFADAEKLKDNVPINFELDEDDKLLVAGKDVSTLTCAEIITARVEAIAQLIKKCIDECPYPYAESMPLQLTGGGISYIRGAKDTLARVIYRNVEISFPDIPKAQKPHLTSGYGALALAIARQQAGENSGGLFKRVPVRRA